MDIKQYFNKINNESQQIFTLTLSDHTEKIGKAQHLTSYLFEFSECLSDVNEKKMLATVSSQIETATLTATLGLYRQAFSSLRLAFEMGLSVVFFSINKLDHFEWINGKGDIRWSKLVDKDNGILSKRFSNAFFQDLSVYVEEFNIRASTVYRSLSEFVHGNNETWTKSGIHLEVNTGLLDQFFNCLYEVIDIILFSLSCRHLKDIPEEGRESIEFISDYFSHIEPIRVLLGGPKS